MINIKLVQNKFLIKILLIIIILNLILISTSKIVFSKELNKSKKELITTEEKLALKYCDAINKNIFYGLEKEVLLKYEYYFSSLKNQNFTNPDIFFKEFRFKLKKICSYKLSEKEEQELLSLIKKFLME